MSESTTTYTARYGAANPNMANTEPDGVPIRRFYINLDKSPETLKTIRKHLGMSQEQLACRLGLKSPSTISHYESGYRSMPLSVLVQVAEMAGWKMRLVFDECD